MKISRLLMTIFFVSTLMTSLSANGKMHLFQSVPVDKALLLQKGNEKKFCPVCGMNLPMFYKTNHAADANGKVKQYCSIHCLVEDIELNHTPLKNIKVVDTHSLKFIDATKAFYVVGSTKKGTMSMVSKYAFAKKTEAEKFAKKYGGKVMNFKEAYMTAKKDFADDARMIAKKQKMMAKKGAMIYNKMCQKTNKIFSSVAEAKAFVLEKKLCGNIQGKKLQAVGLYLYKR